MQYLNNDVRYILILFFHKILRKESEFMSPPKHELTADAHRGDPRGGWRGTRRPLVRKRPDFTVPQRLRVSVWRLFWKKRNTIGFREFRGIFICQMHWVCSISLI